MVAALTIDGAGFQPLQLLLDRFGENIDNPQPMFEDMADQFAQWQSANFGSGGGMWGVWTPLSPAYAAWKNAHYPGKPILTRTGQLRDSMTSRPFGVEVIDSKRMVVGTAVEYAKYHQQGGGNLPRRAIINSPTQGEMRQYGSILHRFAFEGVA